MTSRPFITRVEVALALAQLSIDYKVRKINYVSGPGTMTITITTGLWGWLLGRQQRAAKAVCKLALEQGSCVVDYRVEMCLEILSARFTKQAPCHRGERHE